jgi:hypothetical protein
VPDLELLRALAPPVEPPPPDLVARTRRRVLRERRRRPMLVLTPIAVGAAILAVVLTQLGGGQTFAAAAVRAAEGSPRLLVDGWKVTRVDEWDAGTGEMTFAGDGRTLEVRWQPEDNGNKDLERVGSATITGATAFVGRYPGTDDFTARWRDGDAFVSARSVAPSTQAFLDTLARLQRVSAEEWLEALPPTAVKPGVQADAVRSMLDGIPVPSGFRTPTAGAATRDRYQLGAKVAGALACSWIVRWMDGDKAAAPALASSRTWPILLEMNAEGDFPEVVWQYADAVNGKGSVPAGKLGLTVDETYKDALGC